MKSRTRYLSTVAAGVASIPLVFVVAFAYLRATPDRLGAPRTMVSMPAFGVALAWSIFLLGIAFVLGIALLIQSWGRRRRAARE